MIRIEIKSWIHGSILFSYEIEDNNLRKTILEAIKTSADLRNADLSGDDLRNANLSGADLSGADLRNANLSGADLSGADLRNANLSGAYLRNANLRNANLSGAYLRNADLSGAYLRNANLRNADLSGADLRNANLRNANLSGANLRNANLRNADLSGADLSPIKADFFMILLYAKHEVLGLRQALMDGKVDGSTYTAECACLLGTIANTKKCDYEKIPGLIPDSNRPAERWFLGISKGSTPENNNIAKITIEWIDEFLILIK
jgi:hypothetical protein